MEYDDIWNRTLSEIVKTKEQQGDGLIISARGGSSVYPSTGEDVVTLQNGVQTIGIQGIGFDIYDTLVSRSI